MRHKKLLRLTLALITLSVALGWAPPHFVRCGAARRRAARAAVRAADSSPPGEEPTEDSSQIYEDLRKWEGPGGSARSEEMEGFNKGLYDHLNNRPEYETAKMYDSLKARIDVDDPLKEEFARNRERIENNTGPAPDQTPGEVIDAVLLAPRDADLHLEEAINLLHAREVLLTNFKIFLDRFFAQIQHVRRKQRFTVFRVVRFVRLQQTVEPREQIFRAVIRVQDDRDAVQIRQFTNHERPRDAPGDRGFLILIRRPFPRHEIPTAV